MANFKSKVVEIIPPQNIWVGNEKAKVKLVMYGEYESETCEKANVVVNKLLQHFPDQVKFNFRHFPLTRIHQHSHKAAEASVAAAQEGKFWPMHNLLFANRRNLGTASLKLYAKEAGVMNKKFLVEMMDSVYGWQVRNDLLQGVEIGVRDVPTFYINDVIYSGRITLPEMSRAIEEALTSKKKVPAQRA